MTVDEFSTSTYVSPLNREWDRVEGLYVTGRDAVPDAFADAAVDIAATVETGAAAVARLSTDERVDCVLVDLSLPAESGLDVLERVRAEHGPIPVVLLGAERDGSVATEAINAGADGYFTEDDIGSDQFSERLVDAVDEYRSRRELTETAELLSKLTEYADDALWMFTADWEETAVINEAYEDVWNRSIQDLIEDSTDFLLGVHPEDRDLVQNAMAVLSEGDPVDIEYRVNPESPGESWVGVRARPVMGEDGDPAFVAGYTRDITEHKRREESLASLNETLTDLLQQRDREGVAVIALDIVESVVGRGLASVRFVAEEGDGLEPMAVSENVLDAVGVADENELPTLDPGDPMYDLFERDGSTLVEDTEPYAPPEIDIESLLAVPLDDRGVLYVATEPGHRLTEFDRYIVEILGRATTAALERLEDDRKLAAHREELERSNENLQQFAYIASHDLQEPLRMVSSYVDLLDSESGDQLDEEASEYIEFAVDGAHRMQDMVDGLLQYSRVQTEAEESEPVDTNAVLEETIDALRMRIDETDAEVTSGDLPPVEADANQLGQVFQNLLDNAMTYGGADGSAPTIDVTASVDDGTVTIEVSDDGPGVPTDHHERIFEVFSRGTNDSDGTGIGLAVCQRIVRRHGGEIWVESASDAGSTFAFTLPAATREVTTSV